MLILLMIGTVCTLASVVIYYPWTPSVPNVGYYYTVKAYGNSSGFPLTWISNGAITIDVYSLAPGPPPVETFSSWTFYTLNFIEDVLLYSLFSFLLLVYLDWRKKREYPNDLGSSKRLLLENVNNRD